MSPEDAVDARRAYASVPQPELLFIPQMHGNAVALFPIAGMDIWELGGSILAGLASWAPSEGFHITVTVVNLGWPVRLPVVVMPGNVSGFDLRAAWVEAQNPVL